LEEVLLTALRDSRRNLIMLEEGKKELEAAVGREQMQFERLQFAYKKVDCLISRLCGGRKEGELHSNKRIKTNHGRV
jgi:hypothetical protein